MYLTVLGFINQFYFRMTNPVWPSVQKLFHQVQKTFDMAYYLKQEASSGRISFEVQPNDNWNDNIQLFELPF